MQILYEDDDVLVINKPTGMVVNRAVSVRSETVQDWVESKVKSQKSKVKSAYEKVFYDRSGIAHRLDKDTSGCLLIAKNPTALTNLLYQFKTRSIQKEYTALVYGSVVPQSGTVRAPIGRLPWRRGLFGVMAGGKEAQTDYHVERILTYNNEPYSLVSALPKTGRTHQIRVHLQYINHPIVGDVFYSGKKRCRKARLWCPRLFLHASRIAFIHPVKNKQIQVVCSLPEELTNVIKSMT